MYRFITEEETKKLKTISDTELNTLFQEALQFDDTLLIEESQVVAKGGWFSKTRFKQIYTVYHESRAFDGSAYQARYMSFATGVDRKILSAYLFGIINGGIKARKEVQNG